MFKVNYRDLLNQVIAWFLRGDKFRNLLYSAIKPLSELNDNGVTVEFFNQKDRSFYQFTRFISNFIQFDARTIYLQKYLNDRYDPSNEGIVITNNNTTADVIYLFNQEENQEPVYFYNNWDATESYVIGEYAVSGNHIYRATSASSGDQPPSANWSDEGIMQFAYNNEDIFTPDYTVEVPNLVTTQPDYSNERIQAQINFFNSAGRTYQGVVKENPSIILFTKT